METKFPAEKMQRFYIINCETMEGIVEMLMNILCMFMRIQQPLQGMVQALPNMEEILMQTEQLFLKIVQMLIIIQQVLTVVVKRAIKVFDITAIIVQLFVCRLVSNHHQLYVVAYAACT